MDLKLEAFETIQELFPKQPLQDLFDDPSGMKELVEAKQTRKRKLKQAKLNHIKVVSESQSRLDENVKLAKEEYTIVLQKNLKKQKKYKHHKIHVQNNKN